MLIDLMYRIAKGYVMLMVYLLMTGTQLTAANCVHFKNCFGFSQLFVNCIERNDGIKCILSLVETQLFTQ